MLKLFHFLIFTSALLLILNCASQLNNPLVDAIRNGNRDNVHLLLDNGADVNLKTNGWPPLMLAASYGRLDIMQLLLDKGADINATDCHGRTCWTTLHLAITTDQVDIVKFLLDRGANVNLNVYVREDSGDGLILMSPLILATDQKHANANIVRLLLDKGASVNFRNNIGETAISYAITNGSEDIVQLLKNAGAINTQVVSIVDSNKPPSMYQAPSGSEDQIAIIINHYHGGFWKDFWSFSGEITEKLGITSIDGKFIEPKHEANDWALLQGDHTIGLILYISGNNFNDTYTYTMQVHVEAGKRYTFTPTGERYYYTARKKGRSPKMIFIQDTK